MPLTIRQLVPGDESIAESFLRERWRSSFLLLSNLKKAGLTYNGRAFEGVYVGAFQGSLLIAIAAHYWSGNLILQAPDAAPQVAETALLLSRRPLRGLLGPWNQVVAVRKALLLEALPTRVDSKEVLYLLEFDDLKAPAILSRKDVRCCLAEEAHFPAITEMYVEEACSIGSADASQLRSQILEYIERARSERGIFVLEANGQAVAVTAFHGRAYDTVQLGGVYTLAKFRSLGYGRGVVAGSMLIARHEGIKSALLFTGEHNAPARHMYEAINFRAIGDYGLALFAEGQLNTAARGDN